MSNLIKHAERELDILGLTDDDDMNGAMRKHLLHMVKEFSDEGHSGFSASYALSLLKRLLHYKPIAPLTGEDDEWADVTMEGSDTLYQNKRCSSVFKVGKDGQAYDIDGKVFWEWIRTEDGREIKSYYTSSGSHTDITFPYAVPDSPIREYRKSDAEPLSPPQTEAGLL